LNVGCIAIPCGRDEAIFTEVYGMENRAENLETIEKLNQRTKEQAVSIRETFWPDLRVTFMSTVTQVITKWSV
jgi:hypothetical protein